MASGSSVMVGSPPTSPSLPVTSHFSILLTPCSCVLLCSLLHSCPSSCPLSQCCPPGGLLSTGVASHLAYSHNRCSHTAGRSRGAPATEGQNQLCKGSNFGRFQGWKGMDEGKDHLCKCSGGRARLWKVPGSGVKMFRKRSRARVTIGGQMCSFKKNSENKNV